MSFLQKWNPWSSTNIVERRYAKLMSESSQLIRLGRFVRLAEALAKEGLDQEIGEVIAKMSFSKAQFMQDIFALLFNRCKKEGYFVEFGACDGLEISNTDFLERYFGWRGILAEPALHWHDDLRRNRSSIVDERCVWSVSGDKILFNETAFRDRSSVSKFMLRTAGEVASSYEVKTISLFDLLREHNAPRFIDFISIDVEGCEEDILRSFPFNEYKFGFICVEHHKKKQRSAIKKILKAAGYRQVLKSISGYDGWYIPKDSDIPYE